MQIDVVDVKVSGVQLEHLYRCSKAFWYSVRPESKKPLNSEVQMSRDSEKHMLREYVGTCHLSIKSHSRTLSPNGSFEGYYCNARVRFGNFSVVFPLLEFRNGAVIVYLFHAAICNSPHEAEQSLIRKFYEIELLSKFYSLRSVFLVVPKKSETADKNRFNQFEITSRVDFYSKNKIRPLLERAKLLLAEKQAPEIGYGSHCRLGQRDQCSFASDCLRISEAGNLLRYKGLGKSIVGSLWGRNIRNISDIPFSIKLSKKASAIIQCEKSGKPIIEKEFIAKWLKDNGLYLRDRVRPLIFLDFEAFQFNFPLQSSWGQDWHLFQYSAHVLENESNLIELKPYLHNLEPEPRRLFCNNLISGLKGFLSRGAKVVVYNQSFEKSRLKECLEFMPDIRADLEEITSNMIDLMVPFQKLWYYSPEQRGGYTLKIVYPLMLRILGIDFSAEVKDYNSLRIKNGIEAVSAYQRYAASSLRYSEFPAIRGYVRKKSSLARQLIEYCGLDTSSMYYVLRGLNEIAE